MIKTIKDNSFVIAFMSVIIIGSGLWLSIVNSIL